MRVTRASGMATDARITRIEQVTISSSSVIPAAALRILGRPLRVDGEVNDRITEDIISSRRMLRITSSLHLNCGFAGHYGDRVLLRVARIDLQDLKLRRAGSDASNYDSQQRA